MGIKSIFIILFVVINILNATIPTKESITKLYIATFNRAPDSAGLNYWLHSSLSIEQIAQSFFEQKETQNLYKNLYEDNFINAVYLHVFGRDADIDGLDYWRAELDSHNIDKSQFILAIINGAKGKDAKLLNNKTKVGLYFISKNLNDINLSKEVIKIIQIVSKKQ